MKKVLVEELNRAEAELTQAVQNMGQAQAEVLQAAKHVAAVRKALSEGVQS